jgi:hypothetical protein
VAKAALETQRYVRGAGEENSVRHEIHQQPSRKYGRFANGTSLLEPKQVTAALREQTPDAKPPERVPVRRRKRLARWVLAAALAGSARAQIQPARSKL